MPRSVVGPGDMAEQGPAGHSNMATVLESGRRNARQHRGARRVHTDIRQLKRSFSARMEFFKIPADEHDR